MLERLKQSTANKRITKETIQKSTAFFVEKTSNRLQKDEEVQNFHKLFQVYCNLCEILKKSKG